MPRTCALWLAVMVLRCWLQVRFGLLLWLHSIVLEPELSILSAAGLLLVG